jgi:tetratricopeptide (TPR) repeat protein
VKSTLSAAVCVVLLSGTVAADEIDKDKLRQAVRLPSVSVQFGVWFNSGDGMILNGAEIDVADDIAAVEKSLKGDASDGPRLLNLVELYAKVKDKKKAEAAREKALALYREQVKARPDDGKLLGELGMALYLKDDNDEAEQTLRRALELAPKDWYPRVALGRLLTERALEALVGKVDNLADLAELIRTRKPSAEIRAKSQEQMDEAMKCFNEAVKLAPEEPETLARRAVSRQVYIYYRAALDPASGGKFNVFGMIFSDELLADLDKLTRLRPDDYRTLAIAVIAEGLGFMAQCPPEKVRGANSVIAVMPETLRKSIERKLARLDELADGKDRKLAAGAAEVRGIVYILLFQDDAKAEASLRRAIELNPARDQAWEFLTLLLAMKEQHEKCAEAAVARIKQKDNARNRLMAAKAFAELGQWDKAEEQVRAGLKSEPEDMTCTLALAALCLKRDDRKRLEEAGKHLDAVEKLMQKSTPDLARNDYAATRGVFHVLDGDADRGRELLREVLKRDRDHKTAKKAMIALGD